MKELKILKVRTGSLAGFYSVGFGIVGFITSVLYAVSSSMHFGAETASILKGMAFGITAGVVEVFFITILYSVIGVLIGFLHAVIFNLISGTSGGIVVDVKEQK